MSIIFSKKSITHLIIWYLTIITSIYLEKLSTRMRKFKFWKKNLYKLFGTDIHYWSLYGMKWENLGTETEQKAHMFSISRSICGHQKYDPYSIYFYTHHWCEPVASHYIIIINNYTLNPKVLYCWAFIFFCCNESSIQNIKLIWHPYYILWY